MLDQMTDERNWRNGFGGQWAQLVLGGHEVFLLRPETYMNRSGLAVKWFMDARAIDAEELLVAHDDMDLPLGRIRVRPTGGTGGHRGIESVASNLGCLDFRRLRIGVGRPRSGEDPAEYVLSPFSREETGILEDVLRLAVEAVEVSVDLGIKEAMNRYNGCDITASES